jgi:radical SAM protein with 4Fe4S-binding SPASM domain
MFFDDMGIATGSGCLTMHGDTGLRCDAGRSIAGIDAHGDLFPCIILPVSFGNLAVDTFEHLWRADAAARFREQEMLIDSTCRRCALCGSCSRCHAIAALETGAWDGASPSLCARTCALVMP